MFFKIKQNHNGSFGKNFNQRIGIFFIFFIFLLSLNCSSGKKTVLLSPTGETESVSVEIPDFEQKIPVNAKVKIGILENGLKYYVKKNGEPEKRAELRLIVKAGSILEEENQLGLAHFVEHMAFNGTQKYKKQELLDLLESFGMRLGPDVNASTWFDETKYELHLPTDSLALLETGMDVLKEWAENVSFEHEEIDKERAIIIEERRYRRNAQLRIFEAQLPFIYKDSRYAERFPIGTIEVIENFEYETIKQFYRDWYRPELMAVIAVGDFDPNIVEELIKTKFNQIPVSKDAKKRIIYDIPDNQETIFAIASDSEMTSSRIGVTYKHTKEIEETYGDYRELIIANLYHDMFNSRLQELTQDTDPPFIAAGSGTGMLSKTKEIYNLIAIPRGDNFERALETLLIEAKKVKLFGFTEGELERQKLDRLRHLEQLYNEREKTNSTAHANELVRNYLENEPIPGIELELELVKAFLPGIGLTEVNKLGEKWITDENRIVQLSGPAKEDFHIPDRTALIKVFEKIDTLVVTPFEEKVSEEPLLSIIPTAGSIKEEIYSDSLDVTRWELSNGVKVVLKPTDFKNDEVLLFAQSPGGTSLAPDSLYIHADFASIMVNQGGLGKFGPIEFRKKLQGKVVRLFPTINSLSEGFTGSAAPQDMETMFRLIYLYFTQPRVDSTAFISYKTRLIDLIKNNSLNPEAVFSDTIDVTMSKNHFRRQPLNEEMIEKLNLEKAFDFYRDRFAEAGDFTFYLVGNFDLNTIKPLVLTYFGSLPTIKREENWKDEGIYAPEGVIKKKVYKGIEPKSKVEIIFTGPFKWSQLNRRKLYAMTDVLSIKLRESIREEEGGTYTIAAHGNSSHFPNEEYEVTISFNCDPERVEELIHVVDTQIDSLKNYPTTEKYLVKVREKGMRDFEENIKNNGYWMSLLNFYDYHGEDPNSIIRGPEKFLNRLNSNIIQDAAREYLNENRMATFILLPEKLKD